MRYIKNFSEMNNSSLAISGLNCDNCDFSDDSIKLEDYEGSIGMPCPNCGESLLTKEDYESVMDMVRAVEVLNTFSEDDLDRISANLSHDEIDSALDMINQLKITKSGKSDDGSEVYNIGKLPNKK